MAPGTGTGSSWPQARPRLCLPEGRCSSCPGAGPQGAGPQGLPVTRAGARRGSAQVTGDQARCLLWPQPQVRNLSSLLPWKRSTCLLLGNQGPAWQALNPHRTGGGRGPRAVTLVQDNMAGVHRGWVQPGRGQHEVTLHSHGAGSADGGFWGQGQAGGYHVGTRPGWAGPGSPRLLQPGSAEKGRGVPGVEVGARCAGSGSPVCGCPAQQNPLRPASPGLRTRAGKGPRLPQGPPAPPRWGGRGCLPA